MTDFEIRAEFMQKGTMSDGCKLPRRPFDDVSSHPGRAMCIVEVARLKSASVEARKPRRTTRNVKTTLRVQRVSSVPEQHRSSCRRRAPTRRTVRPMARRWNGSSWPPCP